VTLLDAFMATMVARSPRTPLESAVALVRERYGFATRAVALTGERDENFRLSAADGAEYVLKIASPAEERAVTELPIAALLHIENVDPALPCPRVVRALGGSTQVRSKDIGGSERTAYLLSYLPGQLLGRSARSARQRRACGRIGGRLSLALRGFEHPAAHRALIWDLRQVSQVARLLDEVPEFPFPHAASDLLQRLVPTIDARLPRLRQQVVHNDLNPLNILVEPADEARVAGVIDFGDLTHSALVADVAVTAAEHIPEDCAAGSGGARESIRDVARGYHEITPLLPQELALLGTLVAARLVTIMVVHQWHLHHNPRGGHYTAFDPQFIRARLEIAAELLLEEIRL
jgi:hydroxylysine kinase